MHYENVLLPDHRKLTIPHLYYEENRVAPIVKPQKLIHLHAYLVADYSIHWYSKPQTALKYLNIYTCSLYSVHRIKHVT